MKQLKTGHGLDSRGWILGMAKMILLLSSEYRGLFLRRLKPLQIVIIFI
jgi:hypothetical protein